MVAAVPRRHKDAPPEEQLYAPIEWRAEGDYEDMIYERGESIAKITINRPEVHNAFRPPTLAELRDAFTRARDDIEVGGDHLHRRGRRGVLLRRRPADPRRRRLHRRRRGRRAGRRATRRRRPPRPDPPPAQAGGRDGRRLRRRRRPHPPSGLRPDDRRRQRRLRPDRARGSAASTAASAPRLLARNVGVKKAKEIWFLSRLYDAEEALDMGLVNTVVPLDQLERETVAWCREMAALSPLSLRLLKASFNADRGRADRNPAALPRRDAALLHDRGGPGGPQRLPAGTQSGLLQVPEEALS